MSTSARSSFSRISTTTVTFSSAQNAIQNTTLIERTHSRLASSTMLQSTLVTLAVVHLVSAGVKHFGREKRHSRRTLPGILEPNTPAITRRLVAPIPPAILALIRYHANLHLLLYRSRLLSTRLEPCPCAVHHRPFPIIRQCEVLKHRSHIPNRQHLLQRRHLTCNHRI